MPELPEVQTIVNQLKDVLAGKKITSVEVRLSKMFQGSRDWVLGARIMDIQRRAKMIVIKLDNGKNIVVHLKMTGQLIYGQLTVNKEEACLPARQGRKNEETVSFPNPIPFAGNTLPGKTTHVIFHLNKGTLFFNDMRQFGWIKIVKSEELRGMIDGKLGPEPFSKEFNQDYLAKICGNWGRPIKLLLMDQAKIAGIGNIYANEILWCAGISPMKRGREVAKKPEKIKKLWECMRNLLELGIKYGGSSAADEAFVNAKGEKGHMQEHFVVYQKNGLKCPRCEATITKSRIGGRGTFFCPKCQK